MSTDTLRHYERKRLLATPHRTPGGYRRYPADTVERVRLIQRALVIGFSLEELARVLAERAAGGAPCRSVRAVVGARLTALDQRIEDLTALRQDLRSLVADWDARLTATPPGSRAHLLEDLPHRTALDLGRQSARASGIRRRR